jgi:hypothetical protein
MSTTTRKDAYGQMVETIERTPELKTAPEAAKALGISTRRFGYVVDRIKMVPTRVTGTEKNKYPIMVYTPAQIATIAAEVPLRDGNGRPI